jgi:predicted membrane protein
MRAALIRSGLVLAVAGAVCGVLVALGLRWWASRDAQTDLGWFSYSGTPRRYVDYLPTGPSTDWWGLLWPAALAGAVLGLLVAAVFAVAGRRLTLVRTR